MRDWWGEGGTLFYTEIEGDERRDEKKSRRLLVIVVGGLLLLLRSSLVDGSVVW